MAEETVGAPMGGEEITDDDKLWALLSWLLWPLAMGVVAAVVSAVLSFIIIGCLVSIAWAIYVIYLAIQAYQGQWVTVPFLTDFCKNQGWI